MANFNTHISVAFVASGVTGLVIYKAGMLTAPEYLMCVVAGTIVCRAVFVGGIGRIVVSILFADALRCI